MCMHYCRLCILNLCACCMCYTHYYCHTQTHKWTNTSPLPYSPPCTNPVSDTAITVALFAHSHTRTWHAHASPKWIGHQKIIRPDKTWELFESQLKTNLNFRVHRLHLMDYRQRSEESVDDFVTRARTQALKCEFGGKDHWTHDCIHTNRSIPAWTAGKSQRLQADRRTCRGETFWSHSRRSTGNSQTHKHTTEQCGPSRPSMWQLWQSPSPKSMSGIQRLVHILWKNRTLEENLLKTQRTHRPKEDVQQRGDTKSDGKQHRDPVWSTLLDQITIWTQGVTTHIQSQNGRDLGRPSRRGWDHRWRLCAWQRWRGARPEPESAHGQSKRNRAGVQFRQGQQSSASWMPKRAIGQSIQIISQNIP